jgi:hypothetical protein
VLNIVARHQQHTHVYDQLGDLHGGRMRCCWLLTVGCFVWGSAPTLIVRLQKHARQGSLFDASRVRPSPLILCICCKDVLTFRVQSLVAYIYKHHDNLQRTIFPASVQASRQHKPLLRIIHAHFSLPSSTCVFQVELFEESSHNLGRRLL